MNETVRIARIEDADAVAELARAIQEWEPCLDLAVVLDDPMIYEPDGTLYAVCVSDEATLSVRYKMRSIRRNDAIVVPAAVAIDVDPPVRLVAIRHEGRPPFHFRERFIQTWGYEYRPTRPDSLEVIPESDARFRIPYSYESYVDSSRSCATGLDLHLLVATLGSGVIDTASGSIALPTGGLALIPPGTAYRVAGSFNLGRLRLTTELEHDARQAAQYERDPASWSAEYRGG